MTTDDLDYEEIDDILLHFGVKGMKWGVRKKQDSVRILKAREAVSATKRKLKDVKKQNNKQSAYGLVPVSNANLKKRNVAEREHEYAKEDLSGSKILEKLEGKKKSKQQLKMEAVYLKKGMSAEEAAIAAYKNIKVKKILIGAAILTVAVGAVAVGSKIHNQKVDKVIKAGSVLQNIGKDSDAGVRDAFYASKNKLDNMKYQGIHGVAVINNPLSNGEAFKKNIKAIKDINQASPHNAQKALEGLVKQDTGFRSGLENYLKNDFRLGPAHEARRQKAIASLAKGVIDKNVYEVFNTSLVDHAPGMQKLTDSYFKEMMGKGYNAIQDVNDTKFSGYKAKNPIIAFGTKGIVDANSIQKLGNDEITKAYTKIMAGRVAINLGKQGAGVAAIGGTVSTGINAYSKQAMSKQVNNYKSKHPGTKMTNTEIARMLERKK